MVTMTSSASETSAGLMRLAADGDEVAFARIVDAHHADMSSVCFVVTGGDAELAEEAVQSAWPIAWRKLDTVRDPERLRPWLISIAVNEARQLARRRRRGRVLEISVA
jgi:RNA polymerase sigma-70 factor (ECF subfamily)